MLYMAQKDIRPSLVLNSEKKRKESKKDRIRKYDIAHLLEHCILLDRDFTRAESSRIVRCHGEGKTAA